jgi:transposase
MKVTWMAFKPIRLDMKVVMNVVSHHSPAQLQQCYRMVKNTRLARRIQEVYLAQIDRNCPQIMAIGDAHRTIHQWVAQYNRGGLDGLFDQPRLEQPTKLPRDREEEFRRRLDRGAIPEDGGGVLSGLIIQTILDRECGSGRKKATGCERII